MTSIPNPEQARRMPFDSPSVNNTSTTTSPAHSSKSNPKTKPPQMLTVSTYTAKPPLLNVVTDFSKASRTQTRDLSIQERRKQSKKASSKASSETLRDWNPSAIQSPSDGEVIIGFSLQPEPIKMQGAALQNRKSVAPDIIITPAAVLEDPWKAQKNWRPRSSIYSQATRASPLVDYRIPPPPPIPPIPGAGVLHQRPRPISTQSWHTDFDEDDDREEICRRYSGESQLGIVRETSVNTTRRRSHGWWNTISSPIFGRSNTVKDAPPLPTLNIPSDQDMSKRDRISRSSIWSDLRRLSLQRHTLAFFNDSPTMANPPPVPTIEKQPSPELVQEEGFGLASEYYRASIHDELPASQRDFKLFYECVGHDCSQQLTYRHGKTIGHPDDHDASKTALTAGNIALLSRDLMADTNAEPRGLGNTSVESTIKNSRPATPIIQHSRHDSHGTDIDDEPDARSELHETYSKASSHGSPMPERLVMPSPARSRSTSHTRNLSLSSLQRQEKSPAKLTKSKPVTMSPAKKATARLDDPFADPPFCESPVALTPGMQREFEQHNAIPLAPPRVFSPTNTDTSIASTTRRDVLDIQVPRKAPLPPRIDTSGAMYIPPVTPPPPARPPYAFSTASFRSDSDGTNRGTMNAPLPARTISITTKIQYGHSRDVSLDFAPPPRETNGVVYNEKKVKKDKKKFRTRLCAAISCGGGRHQSPEQKKRKRWCFIIGGALLGIIILIIILVLTLTIHRNDIPIESSWLNITGFPPIPTGIATIAKPNAAIEESNCVAPNTLWSCAVPKEQQDTIKPNSPDQPNFRLEIRFQNGSSALNSSNTITSRSINGPASARLRSRLLKTRDAFTSSLFSPSPPAPNQEDQLFIGKTTDNNTWPFQGEATPFFISFLPTTTITTKRSLEARATPPDPFPNATLSIPPPSVNSDGTAAEANLLPFPSAQPLTLYNRGRNDEHYGFYTYFDRSIFLKSTDLLNSTGPDIADNANGGATKSAADVRCTWSQTRFLVQIWTNSGGALNLLNAANSTSSAGSSATNFARPGSFPYPVSITLDRHGGDVKQKLLYCYGMDETNHIIRDEKQVHLENRGFGGPGLINPGNRLFSGQVNVSLADGGPGGIDGGFGGCRCQWRNWS